METKSEIKHFLCEKSKILLLFIGILTVCILLVYSCNYLLVCGLGSDTHTEIKSLSEELRMAVYEDTGICIPDTAVLICGEATASFRDSNLTLVFEVAMDELDGYGASMDEAELLQLLYSSSHNGENGDNRATGSHVFTQLTIKSVHDGVVRYELNSGDIVKVWSVING